MGKKNKKSSKTKSKFINDGNIQDERFAKAQTHPQFQKRHTKKRHTTAKTRDTTSSSTSTTLSGELVSASFSGRSDGEKEVDDRFKAILTDSRFALGGDIGVSDGAVDRYGRKQKKKKKRKKDGKEPEEEKDCAIDDDGAATEQTSKEEEKSVVTTKTDTDVSQEEDENHSQADSDPDVLEGEDDTPESRIAYLTALSRGEIDISSSSEDESSEGEGDDDASSKGNDDDDDSTGSEDSFYGASGILDPNNTTLIGGEVEITYQDSPFLAICNMDWKSVRSVDILSIISSFAPPGSTKKVEVYPSDFGMERMQKEREFGPSGLWKKKLKEDEKELEEDRDESSHSADSGRSSPQLDNDDETDDDDAGDLGLSMEQIQEQYSHFKKSQGDDLMVESDYNAEKVRAYEASKLKYYFAVVEFTSSKAADAAYKELDGMEVGHSSATMDLRSIPSDEVGNVIEGRKMRDGASTIPSNYEPPDFVVSALQKTSVECSWEEGDRERERLLTQYGVGNDAWKAMTEGDDLRAYLASDISSDEGSEDDHSNDGKTSKGSNLRKMLGLESGDESEAKEDGDNEDDDSFFGPADDDDDDDDGVQEATFIPGKRDLEDKIRSKIKERSEPSREEIELTPWEKYQQKRKEKRKEKKRLKKENKKSFQRGSIDPNKSNDFDEGESDRGPSSREELDLLLAGDNGKFCITFISTKLHFIQLYI